MSDIQTDAVPRKPLPMRVSQFDVGEFAAWLARNGAEIGIPSNPYEVIRYRAYRGGSSRPATHIIYAKENGLLTWPGLTQEHYRAFLAGESIGPGYPPNARGETPFLVTYPTGSQSAPTRAALLERDGDHCWFCGDPMGKDCTIEHLVPKSNGGRNMLANYALAHRKCNATAADLPLVQKIEIRARLRSQFRMLAG